MSHSERLSRPRRVERIVHGRETMEGAGVRIVRVLTHDLQRRLDPFLMLDNFRSDDPDDYIAGFPDHPHRGFETVTFMIAGRMRHRDSAGHEGLLENGGVQWMTAGRGIIHSEMPEQENGVMEGFQLWLNLPAKDKMNPPWYRDFAAAELPRYADSHGVTVQVIAGASGGVTGAVQRPDTDVTFLDLDLPAGSVFEQPIAPGHNAFVCVYRGEVTIGTQVVRRHEMAILANEATADGVRIEAGEAAKAVLLAGRPLGEPIAQYGPFVMNTADEIRQAMDDYRNGRLGRIAA